MKLSNNPIYNLVQGVDWIVGVMQSTGQDVRIPVSALLSLVSVATANNPYKFSAYKTADQTISGTQKITWDTEEYDTGNNFDDVTNNRFTAPIAGFYRFNHQLYWESANVTCRTIWYKNGSPWKDGPFVGNTSNADVTIGGGLSVQLNAGDYIEVYASVSTGSKVIAGTTDVSPSASFFQGELISAT